MDSKELSVLAAIVSFVPFLVMSFGIDVGSIIVVLLLAALASPILAFKILKNNKGTLDSQRAKNCFILSIFGLVLTCARFVNG